MTKDVFVIAGPNGAGKTTSAPDLLPRTLNISEFVNADEIARGLSPFDPEGQALPAARLMLERIRKLVETSQSFAFETTCAGRGHIRSLKACRALGYRMTLIFLWLPSAHMALSRVARRVGEGGHRIPDAIVKRRYAAGLFNMRHYYLPLSDVGVVYDHSDATQRLIVEHRRGEALMVHDAARWSKIVEATS